jgi:hypothetical protein
MVRRVARGAGVRRRHGYAVRLVAQRAWVHALGCARPWASAHPNLQEDSRHGSTAGRSEPRARRVASLWHGGASRGFPSVQHNGRGDGAHQECSPTGLG